MQPAPLTLAEAMDALANNWARIRVVDARSGRWIELDGGRFSIPHLLRLLNDGDGSSGVHKIAVSQPAVNPEIKQRSVLNSWKEIAAYLKRGVRTVQRYHKTLGLPVRHTTGRYRCAVLAFTDELDAWLGTRPIIHPNNR